MTSEITWYQENRVVLLRVQGEATYEEMVESDAEIAARIRQGAQTSPLVHLICEVQSITKMPTNLVELRRASPYLREPGLGWVVIIGMSPVIRFLAGMVTQITGARYRMFATFEEAVAFLASQDESIINLEMQPQ